MAKKMREATNLDDFKKYDRKFAIHSGPSYELGLLPHSLSRTGVAGPGYSQLRMSSLNPLRRIQKRTRHLDPIQARRMKERFNTLARVQERLSTQRYLAGGVDKNFDADVRKFNRASENDQIAMLRQGAFEKFLGPNAMEFLPVGNINIGTRPLDKDALSTLLQPKAARRVSCSRLWPRDYGYKPISTADYIKKNRSRF